MISVHMRAVSSFRATRQGQTYCPLYPPHQELHMLCTPHNTTATITAAIYLFVCFRQLWYSPVHWTVSCSDAVLSPSALSVVLLMIFFSFEKKKLCYLKEKSLYNQK